MGLRRLLSEARLTSHLRWRAPLADPRWLRRTVSWATRIGMLATRILREPKR
jgi:hypothetical protein